MEDWKAGRLEGWKDGKGKNGWVEDSDVEKELT